MRLMLTTDTVGGVWTFTKELSTELLYRGHQVCLVSFGRAPSIDQEREAAELRRAYGSHFDYRWSDAPLEWMQNNATAYSDGAALLLALDAMFAPDGCIFSQFCFGALPIDTPKIVVAHSDVVSWAAACNENLDEDSAWMRVYRDLVFRGLQDADAVVSPTATYLQTLQSFFPHLTPLRAVVANGRTISPQPANERKLQAVTAGRMWDKAKNLSLLQDCALPIPLVVAGELADIPPAANGALQAVGQLNEEQLLRLFRESAVYVCTSVYEPFGMAPLEAALCGCAIVAMDLPTLREVWGEAALYFHDAASLSRVSLDLRDDAVKLKQYQALSRARADRYTASRMADGYIDLLTSLNNKQEAYAA